jgi:hypothetical protein
MTRGLGVVIAVWLLSSKTGFAETLQQPEWIPEHLRVPPSNVVLLRGLAVGVQIYDCRATCEMVPGRGHFDLYGTPPAAIAAKDGLFARIA